MNEKVQMQNVEMTKGSISTYHEAVCNYGIGCYHYILSKGDWPTKQLYKNNVHV